MSNSKLLDFGVEGGQELLTFIVRRVNVEVGQFGIAGDMEKSDKAQDNNFTLNGSKELGVEISFAGLAEVCLKENDRRLAPYDPRLIRPVFVPNMIRLALKFMRKPAAA